MIDLDQALACFASEGYARLGRVIDDDTTSALGARIDDLMLARVQHEGMFFQRDSDTGRYEDLSFGLGWQGPSLDYRKMEKLELDPVFAAYLRNPLFERIARRLVDGPIALYRAVVFTKSARGGSDLPFHQDGGAFWGIDRMPTLQLWTAIDDCPLDGGCLEVVPRTHLAGLATKDGGVVPKTLLDGIEARIVPLPAVRGEVMLVHNHVWHRSRRSQSGQRRSALSVCYMSAATRCLRKKRAPRKFTTLFD
ncbi:MAG: phytanoyl-CoA dioxygenase family protein [Polyangia bacterium]